ncbi:MAG: radical SAM protein [Oligoflexia bacterium]|nr:radical SAM protein [Oligoflexia bacterium]
MACGLDKIDSGEGDDIVQIKPFKAGAKPPKVYMWQHALCMTYLIVFKRMEDFFTLNECEVVSKPEDADWVVIGSCGSFKNEIDINFEAIMRFGKMGKKQLVYGCLPKICPHEYREYRQYVDLYVDTGKPWDIKKIVPEVKVAWDDVPEPDGMRKQDYRQFDPTRRFVVVQYGCNATCNFCPHKVGIGRQKSVSRANILKYVDRVLKDGAKLLFLEGRDLGSWGTDLTPKDTLADLLKDLVSFHDYDYKIFVNQLGGNWAVRDQKRLVDVLLDPHIANIHIPIQTTSDRLLKLMGREPGIRELAPFLEQIRAKSPRPVLRTDLLIGYPTETDDELEDTIEFANQYFDEAACYGFEVHPNTPIARMNLPIFDDSIIRQKVQRVSDSLSKNPNMILHFGGQDYDSMIVREIRKASIGRA